MNPELPLVQPPTVKAVEPPKTGRWGLVRAAVWKFLAGLFLMQSFLGAVVVLGWVWRLSQRFVLKAWWKASPARAEGLSWAAFLAASPQTSLHRHWPNWILRQDVPLLATARADWRALPGALFGSLWLNFKTGAQAILNTWVITLPAGVLWVFAWYDGWNNSFTKGYEQAPVGPSLGVLGIALFIAAMFYVPLAQARQTATGDWRSFYEFRTIWLLIRKRWLHCLGLAMVFSALSLPVMALKTAPGFFTHAKPKTEAAAAASVVEPVTATEALSGLRTYYFFCGLYLFPALVLARLFAARIYASAVRESIQRGTLTEEALHESEWQALHRLDLLFVRPQPVRHRLVRLLAWVGTRVGKVTVGFAMILVWFTLAAQVFIGEFLLKNDRGQGWLNQPLIQLPWFDYTPGSLIEAAKEEQAARPPSAQSRK